MRGRAPVERKGAATSSAGSKRSRGARPGSSAASRGAVELLARAVGVVTQRLHAPGRPTRLAAGPSGARRQRRRWRCAQARSSRVEATDADDRAPASLAASARARARRSVRSRICITAPSSSVNRRREQRRRASARQVERQARVAGERHLAHRREQAAVGPVVVGEDQAEPRAAPRRRRRSASARARRRRAPRCPSGRRPARGSNRPGVAPPPRDRRAGARCRRGRCAAAA